ncbi:MAG: HEAT repeat domain-containing protein [Candidatus Aminicenantes bacterium]|nr:HEAT repeat domain-containing protein [Candidatus Aminicenantes bacterium]
MGLFAFLKPDVAKMEEKKDVAGLIKALRNSDWLRRRNAVQALGKILDARAVEPLVDKLKDWDKDVRNCAAEALEKFGLPSEPEVQAWYWVAKEDFNKVASLGYIAVQTFIMALNDLKSSACHLAVDTLGTIGDARAVEPLIAVLKKSIDPKSSLHMHVIESLGKIGDSKAVEPLIQILQRKDKWYGAAIKALGDIGDAMAVWPLVQALNDPNSSVRFVAAEALSEIGDARAVEPLIKALKDSNSTVRGSAAMALGEIGDERAVEPLKMALNDANEFVHSEAANALVRIGNVRNVDPYIIDLKSGDWDVRRFAARKLGKIGDVRAIEPLMAVLKDSKWRVSKSAEKALKKLGWQSNDQDQKMLEILVQLCDAYVSSNAAEISKLEPLATQIGKTLHERGGLSEMRRLYEQLGERKGSRTLEMHWNGIGDWRG